MKKIDLFRQLNKAEYIENSAKNTRKDYYTSPTNVSISSGDNGMSYPDPQMFLVNNSEYGRYETINFVISLVPILVTGYLAYLASGTSWFLPLTLGFLMFVYDLINHFYLRLGGWQSTLDNKYDVLTILTAMIGLKLGISGSVWGWIILALSFITRSDMIKDWWTLNYNKLLKSRVGKWLIS